MQKGNFIMENLTNEERKWCVYVHINKVNGKRYVGITSRKPKTRWGNGNDYGAYFYNAIQKYGWDNFEHIVLCSKKSEREAKNIEKYLIKNWNTKSPYGYNCTDGGDGTLGFKNPRPSSYKSVLQFDLEGNLIKEWESLRSTVKGTNRSISGIFRCCQGKANVAYGYIWMYKEEYENNRYILQQKLNMNFAKSNYRVKGDKKYFSILQYNLDGDFIKEFDTVKEVSEMLGKGFGAVCNALSQNKIYCGFIWKYRFSSKDNISLKIEVPLQQIKEHPLNKKIICLEDNKIFDTSKECADFYKLNRNSLQCVCRNEYHILKGRHFMWLDDYIKLNKVCSYE